MMMRRKDGSGDGDREGTTLCLHCNLMKIMNSTGIMTQNGTETRMHASGPPVSFLLLSFGFQSVPTQGADSLS